MLRPRTMEQRRRWKAALGLWAAGVALGLWVGERPARAQNAGDKAAAEALFDAAKKLYAEKKFAEACARFDASEKLDPGVGTLLYLADCYEHVGRTASAWATFREAGSLAKVASQAERERIAHERAALLEPKLYRLTVTVAATPPGLKVMRGDEEVQRETFGTGLPVDPGTYAITATAKGKKPVDDPGAGAAGGGRADRDRPRAQRTIRRRSRRPRRPRRPPSRPSPRRPPRPPPAPEVPGRTRADLRNRGGQPRPRGARRRRGAGRGGGVGQQLGEEGLPGPRRATTRPASTSRAPRGRSPTARRGSSRRRWVHPTAVRVVSVRDRSKARPGAGRPT